MQDRSISDREADALAGPPGGSAPPAYITVDRHAEPPDALMSALGSDGLVVDTYRYDRPGLLDQSPRGYDRAMVRLLVREGFDDQLVVDSVIAMRVENFSPVPKDAEYYRGLLQMARGSDAATVGGPGDAPADLNGLVEEHGVVPVLADLLEDRYHFAVDQSGQCFVFERGRYVSARPLLDTATRRLLEEGNARKHWSASLPKQIGVYLVSVAPPLWSHPGEEFLNVLNGLIELGSGTLHRHDPGRRTTVQLPVVFDPEARCPGWDMFAASTFPHDAHHVAYELLALTMVPNPSVQKAILLLGGGGNGKSTYLRGMEAFLGRDNLSSVSLQRLEGERFSTSRLDGKLANICADLPAKELAGSSVLKSVTGGDTITSERKYEASYDLTPFARLLFSANTPPSTPDADEAFFGRWYVVPFDQSFRGTGNEIPAKVLAERLAAPGELSGLLNRALEHLPAVRARGVSEPPSLIAAHRAFRAATDPVAVWLDTHTVPDPAGVIPKRLLLDAHSADAKANGRTLMTANAFGRAVHRARPTIGTAQRRLDGHVVEVWTGIALTEGAQADVVEAH